MDDCVAQQDKKTGQVTEASCKRCWARLKYQSAIGGKSKCSNVPMECIACKSVLWKYGMTTHWAEKHQGASQPVQEEVDDHEAEVKMVQQADLESCGLASPHVHGHGHAWSCCFVFLV